MLYYLHHFKEIFSPLNVLGYITFRAGGAILTSLALTWIFGSAFVNMMRRFQITQSVRTEGPPSHHSKSGTPTMGGVLILLITVISALLWTRLDNRFVWLALITVVFLGILGFFDDYSKWKGKGHGSTKGVSASFKIGLQMVLGLGIVTYLYIAPSNALLGTQVNVPYFKNLFFDMGPWYVFFALFIIVGSSNAVNLTDGLDGLAIGSLVISALTFSVFAYLAGHAKFSTYLKIVPVAGAGELAVFLAGVVGAGLGFLWFNSYPATIFMGDTGSLFLGGLLGLVAVIIKQELILVIVGGLFVAEALSVLIQVWFYRTQGKRVFKMAPLHHHFELSGWRESKVTIRFWIIAIVLSLVALSSLKLR